MKVLAVEDDVDSVLADASQMEMALLNLMINARDAMGGRGRIRLQASCAQPPAGTLAAGDYVRLAVSDNGPGMSPEVTAKVFEPFFTTKAVGKGTGLGLSQVYGMAQQSGGAAFVHSVPGERACTCRRRPSGRGAPRGTGRGSRPRCSRRSCGARASGDRPRGAPRSRA